MQPARPRRIRFFIRYPSSHSRPRAGPSRNRLYRRLGRSGSAAPVHCRPVSEFDGSGEIITRRRWTRYVGLALMVGGPLVHAFASGWWSRHVPLDSFALMMVGYAILMGGRFARVRRRVELHAGEAGLRVNGALVAPRRTIVRAHRVTGLRATVRVVQKGWSTMDASLASEEAAQSLVAALGLATGQALASFAAFYGGQRKQTRRVLGLAATVFVGIFMASVVTIGRWVGPPLAGYLMVGAFSAVLAARLWGAAGARVTVDVGSDGLLLRRIARRRFVSFADVLSVASDEQDVVLGLRSGEWLRLGLGAHATGEESREALIQRIEEGRVAFIQGR